MDNDTAFTDRIFHNTPDFLRENGGQIDQLKHARITPGQQGRRRRRIAQRAEARRLKKQQQAARRTQQFIAGGGNW